MNKIISLCLFFVLVLLNSCKNDENPASPNNNNKVSDGSNIMPLNKGAWFKYYHNNTQYRGYITNTVTGEKVINGKTYAIMENDYNYEIGYTREENGVLYSLVMDNNTNKYFEVKQVSFNSPQVGEKWSYDLQTTNIVNRQKFDYLGNDFSFTFQNKEYNATKIRLETIGLINGNEAFSATSYYWYTKGIGFVFFSSSSVGTIELVDYGTK